MKKSKLTPALSILVGVLVSLLTSFLFALLLGLMVSNEKIPETMLRTAAPWVNFISAAIGSLIAVSVTTHNKLMVSVGSAVIYLLLLLILNGSLFGASIYRGLLPMLLVAGSGILVGFLSARKKKSKAFRYR